MKLETFQDPEFTTQIMKNSLILFTQLARQKDPIQLAEMLETTQDQQTTIIQSSLDLMLPK